MNPHDGTLVISTKDHTDLMHKVLIDSGSFANVIFKSVYPKQDLPLVNISSTANLLISFLEDLVQPFRSI